MGSKFNFRTQISIVLQNFRFFDKNFNKKIDFSSKISFFHQNFGFIDKKFQCFIKISFFQQNFGFIDKKFQCFIKISFFCKHFFHKLANQNFKRKISFFKIFIFFSEIVIFIFIFCFDTWIMSGSDASLVAKMRFVDWTHAFEITPWDFVVGED